METDARTFSEIWASLGPADQYNIREQIMKKTGASPNLFWFWKNGKSNPSSRTDRRIIAKIVSDSLQISITESTLFPRIR